MTEKFHLFNQMAGPLFRELACAVAEDAPGGAVLYTGHPDTVSMGPEIGKLTIKTMPRYDRRSKVLRLTSWLRFTVLAMRDLLVMPKSEVAILVSNPPTMGPVAWLARLVGRRYYVLVYDLHPDTMISMGTLTEGNPISRIWRWVNRRVWNASEGVVTIGGRMADRLSLQFTPGKTRTGRVDVVPVWVDTQTVKPMARADNHFAADLGIQDKIIVLYSGNMGFSHDIDSILEAAKMLAHRDDIAFALIGEGAKWQDAHDFQKENQLNNLIVLPFQPEEVLPYSLGMADLALVSLDVGAEGLMIPSKTYYYMAAGAAVLAICQGESELTDTIKASGGGVQIDPGSPETLAAAIEALADDTQRLGAMKSAARQYCVTHHEREACTRAFLDILAE